LERLFAMSSSKSGWRALFGLGGRDRGERPATASNAPPATEGPATPARAPDAEGAPPTPAEASAPSIFREDRVPEVSPEPPAEGEPSPADASREERLEAEIRELRAESARLRAALAQETSARSRLEEEVNSLADHDPLTGLASGRRFHDRLGVAIIHAQRYKQKLAVVQLGIDHFGKVNERLGRDAGDDVLKSVSLALESTLRQGDTIARFGEDVFTILLPSLKRDEDMMVIADKLRLALRSPFSIGGHDLLITASLGAALFPDDGPDADTLLQNATVSLKRAKERGGDSWDVYAEKSRKLALERQARESALRRALALHDLTLYWQPLVECETGAIVGVEALLRWLDLQGQVPAAESVSLAETSGLAVPLGQWTLREACKQGKAWHRAGYDSLVVAVNVSWRQLDHPAMVKLVRRVLEETGLPAACLELEVSESELVRKLERAIERLSELRELGVRIALDDFGTGESRLGHLYRYPIDTLKIDGSVVAGAVGSRDHEAVIAAAVALARSRKLRVVAEGVETEAQRVLLVRWQCDRMQGQLCGPPASAADTEQLLLRQRKAVRAFGDGGGRAREA
jgi:diguanylate cyclase (GGDEF)-like protein